LCRRALLACDEALALYQPPQSQQSQQPQLPQHQSQLPHRVDEMNDVDVNWLQSCITIIE